MKKQNFKKNIVLSSVLTAAVIVLNAVFCVMMFQRYAPPEESNTTVISGTVTEVYHALPINEVVVAMSDGERLQLVYPASIRELYSAIGCDVEELADLLEGKEIQCRRMDRLPWVVEMCVDDIKIDNHALTNQQTAVTRGAIVVFGLINLVLTIVCDIAYLTVKYQCHLRAKKKQAKKEKRQLRKQGEKT